MINSLLRVKNSEFNIELCQTLHVSSSEQRARLLLSNHSQPGIVSPFELFRVDAKLT